MCLSLGAAKALSPESHHRYFSYSRYPRDCDRSTLRSSAVPARRREWASALASARGPRGRGHLFAQVLELGEVATSTTGAPALEPLTPRPRSTSTPPTPDTDRARYHASSDRGGVARGVTSALASKLRVKPAGNSGEDPLMVAVSVAVALGVGDAAGVAVGRWPLGWVTRRGGGEGSGCGASVLGHVDSRWGGGPGLSSIVHFTAR